MAPPPNLPDHHPDPIPALTLNLRTRDPRDHDLRAPQDPDPQDLRNLRRVWLANSRGCREPPGRRVGPDLKVPMTCPDFPRIIASPLPSILGTFLCRWRLKEPILM